jgi:hypothetical protein
VPSGNHLSLGDLACAGTDLGATPARLVRLTGTQYRNTVTSLLGRAPGNDFVPPFTYVSSVDRFSTHAASYTMTDDELAASVVDAEIVGAQLVAQQKASPTGCLARTLATPELGDCLSKLVAQLGEIMFRRPIANEEVATYTRLALSNLDTLAGGREAAVALAFQSMLLAPDFLFRIEVGEGRPDAQGRRRLGPYELATALAYGLTDQPPDTGLRAAAKDGSLATADGLRSQVARLVGTPAKGTSRFYDFMREYLQWERVPAKDTVAIDRSNKEGYFNPVTYSTWDARSTVRRWLTERGRSDFWKTAMTSSQFLVRGFTFAAWDQSRAAYEKQTGVKVELEKDLLLELPADRRAGFLSFPAFMLNHSDFNGHNKVVQRGRFIRESLLCKEVPELPIGSVPPLPEGKLTMREKLKVHSETPACAACHRLMDGLGLIFEGHDDVGRTRALDEGKPIDESGSITDAGAIDGPVVGIPQLAQRLAASSEVEACFVRQNFRYLLARPETAVDGCTIRKAQAAYRASGGDYVALFVGLLTSESFLARQGGAP